MKIVIEANIPYIRGIFEPYATVEYLAAGDIDARAVADADALLVRTRTRCDASLLDDSRCRFVGTATIGTDHIDLDYCRHRGITVVSAPGCNAPAVAQYVLATIGQWCAANGLTHRLLDGRITLGIVGVGHVGSIIARQAHKMGIKVLECDPPRKRAEGGHFVDFATIAALSDIITFHTPLTASGRDATLHMADAQAIAQMSRCRLLINSSRGPVVDNAALADALSAGSFDADIAIDCWEGEPYIDSRLLDRAFVATPHIAGYSSQGKHRATDMMVAAVAAHFGLPLEVKPVDMGNDTSPSLEQVMQSYNPLVDTAAMRQAMAQRYADGSISHQAAKAFETLRNTYNLRNEPLQ